MYEVEYTDEFEHWWEDLSETEQISIAASVGLLERLGPQLKYPHSSGIEGSKYEHMRELRIFNIKASPIESFIPLILAEFPFY